MQQLRMSARSPTPVAKVQAGRERSRLAGSREPQRLQSGPQGSAPRGSTLRPSQQSPRTELRQTDHAEPSVGSPSVAGAPSSELTNTAPALLRATTQGPP